MNLEPGCVERCPACSHREFTREESESRKLLFLKDRLAPWSALIEPVRGTSKRLKYREKTRLFASFLDGSWKFGVRRKTRFQEELIAIPDCPVHSDRVNRILKVFSKELPENLPLVFVQISGEIASLVLKSHERKISVPWEKLARDTSLRAVFLNFNPSAGNRVFSSRGWVKVFGDELSYGPDSFQQLIPELHENALVEAAEFLSPENGDAVLDFCSGTGASLEIWKKRGADAIGVELSGESVRFARDRNLICLQGRTSERLPQFQDWLNKGRGRTLAFMNPPRIGMEREVLSFSARNRISKIAYLSCSPGTLAKDLSILESTGYSVRKIIPYDFFPQTHHLESLALLDHSVPGLSDRLVDSLD